MNVLPHVFSVRQPVYRKITPSRWPDASPWTSSVPKSAAWLRHLSPRAARKWTQCALSAPVHAKPALLNVPSTRWNIAKNAPRLANFALKPAAPWRSNLRIPFPGHAFSYQVFVGFCRTSRTAGVAIANSRKLNFATVTNPTMAPRNSFCMGNCVRSVNTMAFSNISVPNQMNGSAPVSAFRALPRLLL